MDKTHKANWQKSVGNKFRNTGKTRFKKGCTPWNSGEAMGVYGTPFYQSWLHMKSRCHNKKDSDYKRYGERGITICNRWNKFKNFYNDMCSTYKKGLTIDRIDNNGNYSPGNCRWATRKEQANNTRHIEKAKKYYYKGIEDTIANWAKFFRIKKTTLYMRLNEYGWSIEKAFFTPVGGGQYIG